MHLSLAIFTLSLVSLVSLSEGQERCGLFEDCICRASCWDDIESPDIIGGFSCSDNQECCCSQHHCGLLDTCDCRRGCEGDEYESPIFGCDDQGLNCCCYDDGSGEEPPEMEDA